jgi:hypothetical protein
VFPGLDGAALYQYGAHFDEGTNYGFLGRDFHYSGGGDADSLVYFRMQLSATQSPALVFKLTTNGSCEVDAQAGYWSGGTFIAYAGEVYHYVHIAPSISSPTYTTGVTTINASAYVQVGTVASVPNNHPDCVEQSPQLHQSADVGPTTPVFRNIVHTAGETCWSDSYGGHTWQCAGSYKTHVTSPDSYGCGSYSGSSGTPSGLVYGPPPEYACEGWSYFGQMSEAAWGPADKVFYVFH